MILEQGRICLQKLNEITSGCKLVLGFLRFFSFCIFGPNTRTPLVSLLRLLCSQPHKSKRSRRLNTSSSFAPTLIVLHICERALLSPVTSGSLRDVAIQVARIADWINGSITLKRLLLNKGFITKTESLMITKTLLQVNSALKTINERVRTYSTFDPPARTDLLKLIDNLSGSMLSRSNSHGLLFRNAGERQKFVNNLGQAVKLYELVLYRLLSEEERENVFGDLEEEYLERRVRYGTLRARIWLYRQILNSIPPLAWKAFINSDFFAWVKRYIP